DVPVREDSWVGPRPAVGRGRENLPDALQKTLHKTFGGGGFGIFAGIAGFLLGDGKRAFLVNDFERLDLDAGDEAVIASLGHLAEFSQLCDTGTDLAKNGLFAVH